MTEVNVTEELALIKSNLATEITDAQAMSSTDFSAIHTLRTVKPYLDSILTNLIQNAIKYRYTTGTPRIKIKTERLEEYTCLLVNDNGLGIDLALHQQQLFHLHKRFHAHVEGKGMGLYLVKTLVMALGRKIEVESQVNKDTAFKVFLKDTAV